VWAIVLDEGRYVASVSTMCRVLRACDEVRERRAQATHPKRARPELMADKANMCCSWDITKLRGPDKGVWFDLYIAIDVFSRYVVGWMVATTETAELAEEFITAAVSTQGVARGELNIHADRGTSMTSKGVAELLADLGVGRAHSRPHVSNDNPFSEAVNKTLKYCPAFPARFGSIEDARIFCEAFFEHYNHHHRHSGIGVHTPASVHYGTAAEIRGRRAETLDAAYAANPRRFGNRRPSPPRLPTALTGSESNPRLALCERWCGLHSSLHVHFLHPREEIRRARCLSGASFLEVLGEVPDDGEVAGVEPTVLTDTRPDMSARCGKRSSARSWSPPRSTAWTTSPRRPTTRYGLGAGIWTKDISKAHALAKKIRAGTTTVWINCDNIFDAALPFGGNNGLFPHQPDP